MPGVGAFTNMSATVGAMVNMSICVLGGAAIIAFVPATLVAPQKRKQLSPPAVGKVVATTEATEQAAAAKSDSPVATGGSNLAAVRAASAGNLAVEVSAAVTAAAMSDGGESMVRTAAVLVAIFSTVNLITKGVLAGAEAQLAPAYAVASWSGAADPDGDPQQDISEFALGLGVAGLASYAVMAFKPKRRTGAQSAADGTKAAGSSGNMMLHIAGFDALLAWAAAKADELDLVLLLLSLLLSAAGTLLLSAQPLPLSQLAAGFTLVWSVSAPVADVLSVSLASTALTRIAPGSQAAAMGWLSAAGSVGRILWPLGAVWLGMTGSSFASAATCVASAVSLVALYVRNPQLPGGHLFSWAAAATR